MLASRTCGPDKTPVRIAIVLLLTCASTLSGQNPGQQAFATFLIDSAVVHADTTFVRGRIAVADSSIESLVQLFLRVPRSFAVTVKVTTPDDDWMISPNWRDIGCICLTLLADSILPGAVGQPIEIRPGMLGVARTYSQGRYPRPSLPGWADTMPLPPDPDPFETHYSEGVSAAVVPFPSEVTGASLLAAQQELQTTLCGGGWSISASVCEALQLKLQAVMAAHAVGRSRGAVVAATEYSSFLIAERGGSIAETPFWLLYANFDFLRSVW